MLKTQKQQTQKQVIENTKTDDKQKLIDDLQKQVIEIENKQKQKIENLKTRVNNNLSLQKINDYLKTNTNFSLKPCNNEYHKIFVKYNDKNCMFLLVKSNNTITFYTKTPVNGFNGIVNNTYPKQYPNRTTLGVNDLTDDLLNTIFNDSKNNIHVKTDNKQTINELKQQIDELKQQLQQK